MLSKRSLVRQIAAMGVCLAAGAASASAADQTGYLSIGGGYVIPSGDVKMKDITLDSGVPLPDANASLDDGWDVNVGLGLYVAKQFRAEFEYVGQENKVGSIDMTGFNTSSNANFWNNLFMLNGYYDIPIADHWSLYVGGGIGALYSTWSGNFTVGTSEIDVHNSNGVGFAYQVKAGVAYEITPTFAITVGYRGWSATNVSTDNTTNTIPWFNAIEAGLRVSF